MSVTAKKWVRRHSPTKGNAKTVLAELAWAADDEGRGAFLSGHQLAAATGLHRNTVDRMLAKLEADGFIVRHRGGRAHCDACRKAQRRVRVFDLVMPDREDVDPNQSSLFDLHHEPRRLVQDVVQVADAVKHQPGASTCTTVVQQEEKRTFNHHHQDTRALLVQVTEILERVRKPGWYVDPIAVEALVMTWSSHKDPLRAAASVVASAMDHEHLNAAKLLGRALEWQRLDHPSTGSARRVGGAPTAPADDEVPDYDAAMPEFEIGAAA